MSLQKLCIDSSNCTECSTMYLEQIQEIFEIHDIVLYFSIIIKFCLTIQSGIAKIHLFYIL